MTESTSGQDRRFILQVLHLFYEHDMEDLVGWCVDLAKDELHFSIRCNDVFWWGCADAEDITPDNFPGIEQAINDVRAVVGEEMNRFEVREEALVLWVSRVRGIRPQGACYPKNNKLWPLFDACGPERETGLGNPCRPGEYKR